MSIAAEPALRDWITSRDIVGEGKPLSNGAFLVEQRSPQYGAYAVIARMGLPVTSPVAEDNSISMAHLECSVYAGTQEASEKAAAALRSEFETLTGSPQKCGTTGIVILVAENFAGPSHVPVAQDGEIYCYQVSADFLLTEGG